MKVLNNVSFCCGSVCVHSIFKFSVNTLGSSLCIGSLYSDSGKLVTKDICVDQMCFLFVWTSFFSKKLSS
jgi:hypothetical protein